MDNLILVILIFILFKVLRNSDRIVNEGFSILHIAAFVFCGNVFFAGLDYSSITHLFSGIIGGVITFKLI